MSVQQSCRNVDAREQTTQRPVLNASMNTHASCVGVRNYQGRSNGFHVFSQHCNSFVTARCASLLVLGFNCVPVGRCIQALRMSLWITLGWKLACG